jgi:hypothetical protein
MKIKMIPNIFFILIFFMFQLIACSNGADKEPLLIYEAQADEPVIAITNDIQDNVYAVTIKGDLIKINPGGDTKKLHAGLKRCGFSNRCLVVLPSGDVVTNECEKFKNVLVKIDPNGKKEILMKLEHSLNCMAVDKSGKIYVGYWISVGNLTVSRFLQRAEHLKGVIAEITHDRQLKPLYEGGIPQTLAVSENGELYASVWGKVGAFRPASRKHSMCGPTKTFWIAMAEQSKIIKIIPGNKPQFISDELIGCSYLALKNSDQILAFGNSGTDRCGIYKIFPRQKPVRKIFHNDKITDNLTSLAVSKSFLFFSDTQKGIYKVGMEYL